MLIYNQFTELRALQAIVVVGFGFLVLAVIARQQAITAKQGIQAAFAGFGLAMLSMLIVVGGHSGSNYREQMGWPLQMYEVIRGTEAGNAPAVPTDFLFSYDRFVVNLLFWSLVAAGVLIWKETKQTKRRALCLGLSIGMLLLALGFGCGNAYQEKQSREAFQADRQNVSISEFLEGAIEVSPTGNSNELTSASRDLNRDDRLDQIELTISVDSANAMMESVTVLSVNDVTYPVPGSNPQGFFGIIDLNSSDGQQEIAVSDLGPSGDYTTNFYAFDGSVIRLLGVTEGLYGDMEFPGDGTLVTTTRANILDTWFYRDTYVLTTSGGLARVQKAFYDRVSPAESVTVLKELALQKSPTDSRVVVTLKPGDVVTIVGCDDISWCSIETAQGISGWFELEDLNTLKGTSLPMSDFLDGLSFAD